MASSPTDPFQILDCSLSLDIQVCHQNVLHPFDWKFERIIFYSPFGIQPPGEKVFEPHLLRLGF